MEKNDYKNNFGRILTILLFFVAAQAAQAAPGDLDTTFGTAGKVHAGLDDNVGSGNDVGNAVAVQADGKLVVAGTSYDTTNGGNSFNYRFSVVRYNTNGSLDTSFAGDGKAFVFLGGAVARAVKIQPGDGKIVVAGYAGSATDTNFAVARFNPDGLLDTSFDGDGIVITSISSYVDVARGLAIQNTGTQSNPVYKIVVAGESFHDFAVVRYNMDGSLDNSFGNGSGKVVTDLRGGDDGGEAVVISGSTIIVAGYSERQYAAASDFAVVRYNANGSLDTSFGNGSGFVTTPIGTFSAATAVAIQPATFGTFKIVVAGYSYTNNGSVAKYSFAVARYNLDDGTRDTTFGSGGIVVTDISANTDRANALLIQDTGTQFNPVYKIVVAGSTGYGAASDFALARYNSNGTLDNSFGSGGIVTTPISSSEDAGTAIALQSGKIVVAGYSENPNYYNNDFAVARYNTNGSLDTSFDGDGIRTDDAGNYYSGSARGVAIQTDGKIVAAGYRGLMRFNSDGTLDTSFSGDGKIQSNGSFYAVAIQTDGKIVAAGSISSSSSSSSFSLSRFNADGSLDTAGFNDSDASTPAGTVVTQIGTSNNAGGNAIAIQSDGKIIVAGYANVGTVNAPDYDFAIVRYNADGTLDGNFDGDGKVTTPLGTTNDRANAVAIQADGKIVVAGKAGNTFAAARYFSDGSLDLSFSNDGKVTTQVVGTGSNGGNAMAIQPNGKIVVAGFANNASNSNFAVVRYNADGSLDTAGFNDSDSDAITPAGTVVTSISTGSDGGNSVAIQTDGKIIVAGYSSNGSNNDFAVVRYNTDGSLDNSYSTDGKVLVDVSNGESDIGYGIALDSIGRAVVVGESGGLFGVTRILGNLSPTAATVSVSGRVLTPAGRSLMNATVLLTDGSGNTRATQTSAFGYYRFDEVEAGQSYILSVRSKRYQFNPQVLSVSEDTEQLNFVAGQSNSKPDYK